MNNQTTLNKLLAAPLLKPEEEIFYSRRIQDFNKFVEEHNINKKLAKETLTPELYKEFKKLERSAAIAKNSLISANTRLVVSIAKRYISRGIDFEDLIQDGIIGLDNASNKFDSTRGCRFSTYATYWIKQAITRAIGDKSRNIRIPVHLDSIARRIPKIRKDRPLITEKELAEELEISINVLRNIERAAKNVTSLDKEITNHSGQTVLMSNLIEDLHNINPEEDLETEMLKYDIQSVLSMLTPQQEKVIKLRYGIGVEEPWTLERIAEEVNLSRETVRQMENKVKYLLRTPPFYQKLIGYNY
jgi:RNA polymerase sigma factor (sigma-70 family)